MLIFANSVNGRVITRIFLETKRTQLFGCLSTFCHFSPIIINKSFYGSLHSTTASVSYTPVALDRPGDSLARRRRGSHVTDILKAPVGRLKILSTRVYEATVSTRVYEATVSTHVYEATVQSSLNCAR